MSTPRTRNGWTSRGPRRERRSSGARTPPWPSTTEATSCWRGGTVPGWQSGGNLRWQAFDAGGRPRGDTGRAEAPIPARSVPAAVTRADGSFVIVY